MAFILALIMAIAVLAVELMLRKNRLSTSEKVESVITFKDVDGVKVSEDLSYHPYHLWMKKIDAQHARVGLDDFGRRLVGKVKSVILPIEGSNVESGQSCVRLKNGNKVTPIVAPIAGEVFEINPALKQNPELVFTDPYGEGWLFTVKSWNVIDQLKCMLNGKMISQWMDTTISRLQAALPQTAGAVAQDGGLIVDDLSEVLDKFEWIKLVRENLGTEPLENN